MLENILHNRCLQQIVFSAIIVGIIPNCIKESDWSKETFEMDLNERTLKYTLHDLRPKLGGDKHSAWEELKSYRLKQNIDSSIYPVLKTTKFDVLLQNDSTVDWVMTESISCAEENACSNVSNWDRFLELVNINRFILSNSELIFPLSNSTLLDAIPG